MDSVFLKIIKREIPARIFHEDDDVIIIADHRPKSPVHLLIIPKVVTRNFYETTPEILQMLNGKVKMVAEKLGISNHFRIIINNGFCQEIDHLHYHFMSDRGADKLIWIK